MGGLALPHPDRIRPGQRFFPRKGRRRQPVTVRRIDGEGIRVLAADGSERSLSLDRLLAVGADGRGTHYQFLGWRPRACGYRTEIEVASIAADRSSCSIFLPEWDPGRSIDQPLSVLPESLRKVGARGTCLGDLASSSIAGLKLQSWGQSKVRGASRRALAKHPTVTAAGQSFRNRRDGSKIRLLGNDDDSESQGGATDPVGSRDRIRAWNGRRVVRVSSRRLLAVRDDGRGRFYEYLGGGIWAARRSRQVGIR